MSDKFLIISLDRHRNRLGDHIWLGKTDKGNAVDISYPRSYPDSGLHIVIYEAEEHSKEIFRKYIKVSEENLEEVKKDIWFLSTPKMMELSAPHVMFKLKSKGKKLSPAQIEYINIIAKAQEGSTMWYATPYDEIKQLTDHIIYLENQLQKVKVRA